MKCSYCDGPAVFVSALGNKRYCELHFAERFEEKVLGFVDEQGLLSQNERIAVACSGGKDSVTLLSLLSSHFKNVEAIIIDEGIAGYREHTLKSLRKFCSEGGIKLNEYSFRDEFGFALDELEDKEQMCRSCGVLRRKLLNKAARGFDKIATGHNLDDEAQSLLMNLCQANMSALERQGPSVGVVHDKRFVPRVKPLYLCEEKECMIYAMIKGFDIPRVICPYAGSSFRNVARAALDNYEAQNPGCKRKFVMGFLKELPRLRGNANQGGEIGKCSICGDATSLEICHGCAIKLGFDANKSDQ